MVSNYFHIGIYIKGRKKHMQGIREYHTSNVDEVYNSILNNVLKYYVQSDILKIDVWILSGHSPELKTYLETPNPYDENSTNLDEVSMAK